MRLDRFVGANAFARDRSAVFREGTVSGKKEYGLNAFPDDGA
jgi:hypothetical protein|tara:strand:+ start:368 stop:493 length:126 start_codon:yes stop_codon:yes gene_type:complete